MELLPPDEIFRISDTESFVNHLNDIKVYEEDDSYKDVCGRSVVYTIEKNSGDPLTVTFFADCIIIDGIGYKCEHDSYEAIYSFALDMQN